MAKITKFDKANLAKVRAAFDKAIASVEAEFGIKVDLGNIRYNEQGFKGDISAIVKSGVVEGNPYMNDVPAEYIANFKKFFRSAPIGVEHTFQGRKFVVVGVKNSAFIARKAGEPSGQMYRLKFAKYDAFYCAVTGETKPSWM